VEATGTLFVRSAFDEQDAVFAWNGNVNDRNAARAAFDAAVKSGGVLAAAFPGTTPMKGVRVTSFAEVETIEREAGTVTVRVSPGLVGG
jgi:hypothetical protein